MHRKVAFLLAAFLVLSLSAEARTIGGVEMDETYEVNGTQLVLNGVGIREKFFADIYVAGLYLKEKSSDFRQIMDADEPMAIRIVITSKLITAERFKEA